MPKKPKPEPKAVERERPYEMISPEPDGEERVVVCCAQKRGRGPRRPLQRGHPGEELIDP
jgi:hypothetical protein